MKPRFAKLNSVMGFSAFELASGTNFVVWSFRVLGWVSSFQYLIWSAMPAAFECIIACMLFHSCFSFLNAITSLDFALIYLGELNSTSKGSRMNACLSQGRVQSNLIQLMAAWSLVLNVALSGKCLLRLL